MKVDFYTYNRPLVQYRQPTFMARAVKVDWNSKSGKGLEISLDDAEVLTQGEFREKLPDSPPFLFSATFGGFDDAPLTLAIEQKGGLTLADLMMGGGGTDLPELNDFGFLTALDECLTLAWAGGETEMRKGDSFFLPCACPKVRLRGEGRAALSMPRGE